MSYIEVKNISKKFGKKEVLKNINLSIEKGEFVTFLGSSGCGKTTLLRTLIGLESVENGRIYMEGRDITDLPSNQRNMVMIFQQYCLFPTMNVYQNVAFSLKMKKVRKNEIKEKVEAVLDLVDLRGHEKKYPYQLSGGEQQRVSLARVLITNPKVMLLDEPFSAIDAKLRKELQIRVKEIHRKLGMTSIFVTHDQEEAMIMSDKIFLFRDGLVEQSGSAEEIYTAPVSDYVASFIGHYNRFTTEEFYLLTGEVLSAQYVMAGVRPELIKLSLPGTSIYKNSYQWEGDIIDIIPQGNVWRYKISCNGIIVLVDELFDCARKWNVNQRVSLNLKRNEIIFLS